MERLRIEAEQYREGLEEKAAQVRLEYRKVAAEREATVDERLRITRLVGEATPAEQKKCRKSLEKPVRPSHRYSAPEAPRASLGLSSLKIV